MGGMVFLASPLLLKSPLSNNLEQFTLYRKMKREEGVGWRERGVFRKHDRKSLLIHFSRSISHVIPVLKRKRYMT
jgi:hypothetical protein